MTMAAQPTGFRLWPRTLRARLFVILLAGLTIAHVMSFTVLFFERYTAARSVMFNTLENDIATSIAILDRLPASERAALLDRLGRDNYSFILGPGVPGNPSLDPAAAEIASKIERATGLDRPVKVETIPGSRRRLQAHLTLSDGSPLTIDVYPKGVMPLADWLPFVLIAQLALLLLCSWFAMRQAVRPLVNLAEAADTLDPNRNTPRLNETGPTEVAYAATAFNAMRDRIAQYLEERVQILAAISHDLQTPITRMKLRAEMAEDFADREKLIQDLGQIESLVKEGVAYARSAHGNVEKTTKVDLSSFIESLVYDYQDTGKPVTASDIDGGAITTRPQALRRILTNLVDNALKFGGCAEIVARRLADDTVVIAVLDRGPGIPDDQLQAVLKPFFRLEDSRNRDTGGTGLGLAIAQQLAASINATLTLKNRAGGGLVGELVIRREQA
ncbi:MULTISPECIES: HAMP domain-containing sensor histidine kinase [unclassified Ensifer]|uniref:sensor histidine kinase n=1 Tax=unclassified Ensifer TaxID=2633371 RepID=UPI000812F055|nr:MULTISPECIES: HAMP domain-containing sensor histidine kinase [unclassified Ensifer]OCO98416.1 two-component sensor histidine kinase [Ensifer sp. LC11]OCP05608.1 two-component sensor histidine kinase [Ensifer sp. LC13]OCP13519.1 two-component sensor histidine kinase [Ensifer sp. LC14]OCP30778.1 two-component sensor histidine kinase [Ensifer sp. LC499]